MAVARDDLLAHVDQLDVADLIVVFIVLNGLWVFKKMKMLFLVSKHNIIRIKSKM